MAKSTGLLRRLKKKMQVAETQAATNQGIKRSASSQNVDEDVEQQGTDELMESICEDLLKDKRLIVPVYSYMKKQKQKLASRDEGGILSSAQTWDLPCLQRLPDDFKVEWLSAKSGATPAQLFKLMKVDSAAINYMIQMAIQVPPRAKLPDICKYQEVVRRWLEERYTKCGERLADFNARRGFKRDGSLDLMAVGCYRLEWTPDGILKAVVHSSGAKATTPTAAHITKEYKLMDNFDDFSAALVLAPLPPVRLCSFFPADAGPNGIKNYVGKPKELTKDINTIFTAWEAEAKRAMANGVSKAEILEELAKHRQEKSKEAMNRARAVAKAELQKKKDARSINLS